MSSPPSALGGVVHRLAHGGRIGGVGLEGDGLAAEGLDAGHHLGGLVGRPFVGDRHVGPVLGQAQGDGRADAPAGAGDQGAFPAEIAHIDPFCVDRYRNS